MRCCRSACAVAAVAWSAAPASIPPVQESDELAPNRSARTAMNLGAADTIGADELWPGGASGLGLTGAGVRIGMWDAGDVRTTHVELDPRGVDRDGGQGLSTHATQVAGTIAGAGVNPAARGMAPAAVLDCYHWDDDLAELAAAAAGGLRLSCHAYGWQLGWRRVLWNYGDGAGFVQTWAWHGDVAVSAVEDHSFGLYTARSSAVDAVAFDHPRLLQCWAAGNDRADAGPGAGGRHIFLDPQAGSTWQESFATRDPDGPWDCLPPEAAAKNVLTIGACEKVSGGVSSAGDVIAGAFSGAGPTDDGRIKPDLVAGGVGLTTTQVTGDAHYTPAATGTSMATACAAGSLALLLERWREVFPAPGSPEPLASTLRAIVIHSAHEAGAHPGPDPEAGWGVLNVVGAADLIARAATEPDAVREHALGEGDALELTLTPAPGAADARVTLVWTDPPGAPSASTLDPTTPALVNDLGVRVVDVGTGATFHPWRLDGASPASPALRDAENSVDTVERVDLDVTAGATYRVVVGHTGPLTGGPQAMSLVISGLIAAPDPGCAGDVDGDGDTDVFDFGDLAGSFGRTDVAPGTSGDLDGDGDVDVFDFADLAASFGCG